MPRGTNLEGQLLFQDTVLLDLAQALQFSHLLGIQPELSPAYRKQPLASFLAPPRQHEGMDSQRFSHIQIVGRLPHIGNSCGPPAFGRVILFGIYRPSNHDVASTRDLKHMVTASHLPSP